MVISLKDWLVRWEYVKNYDSSISKDKLESSNRRIQSIAFGEIFSKRSEQEKHEYPSVIKLMHIDTVQEVR